MTQEIIDSVALVFSQGSSDKVYEAEILAVKEGYRVEFRYGRRGQALRAGTKTKAPVSLDKARAVFEKLVQSKTSKGYVPVGENATPFQANPDYAARVSGVLPQLLNPVDEPELERLLRDPGWFLQKKHDGERRLASINEKGQAVGINRKGLTVALPASVAETLERHFPPGTQLDGEIEGNVLYVFDILRLGDELLNQQGALNRHERLMETMQAVVSDNVKPVPRFEGSAKTETFQDLKTKQAEGVVLKQINSPYQAGRPNSGGDQLKFKFIESATVIVTGLNDSKRSVKIGAVDNQGRIVELGNVTIPPNHEIPDESQLVEVEYLYAYPGGSLYQPIYKGLRTDLDREACTLSQLKYKAS